MFLFGICSVLSINPTHLVRFKHKNKTYKNLVLSFLYFMEKQDKNNQQYTRKCVFLNYVS